MKSHKLTFKALGGANEVTIWSDSEDKSCTIANDLKKEVERIEKKFSRYDPESIISKINLAAGEVEIEVDSETADLIDFGELCYKESKGLFDLSSGVLRKVWDFKTAKIPKQVEVDSILPLIGWNKIIWKKPKIFLSKPGMQIDFGGIGKEYAVDRLITMAQELKVDAALINLAGDVRCIGRPPDYQSWKIGINHPREKGKVIGHLELNSRCCDSN